VALSNSFRAHVETRANHFATPVVTGQFPISTLPQGQEM
jgi:hypothetical protein